MPVSRFVKYASGPNGITTSMRNVDASTMYGAIANRRASARSGTMSSFWRNLPTSASSCSEPWGPASIGPSRLCMKLIILNRNDDDERAGAEDHEDAHAEDAEDRLLPVVAPVDGTAGTEITGRCRRG